MQIVIHRGRIDEPGTVKQIIALIDKSDGHVLKKKPRYSFWLFCPELTPPLDISQWGELLWFGFSSPTSAGSLWNLFKWTEAPVESFCETKALQLELVNPFQYTKALTDDDRSCYIPGVNDYLHSLHFASYLARCSSGHRSHASLDASFDYYYDIRCWKYEF